jgi:hypothetical protein
VGVCVKGRKIEIYISALADPDGGGGGIDTPFFFVRKLCQDNLKIARFESGAPMKTQIVVETPTTLENQPHWWNPPPLLKNPWIIRH